jgi:hypothetical protein
MEYLLHGFTHCRMIASSINRFVGLTAAFASMTFAAAAQAIGELKLLDVYVVPFNHRFDNTQVGGLSGIDFDPGSDTYYFICDDRSALQPARFYQARIKLSANRIDTVVFMRKVELLRSDGRPYPSIRDSPQQTVDPEAIRLNPVTGELIWLSEGERIMKGGDTLLVNPAILVTKDGRYTGEYPLPENARMSKGQRGPRQNGSFESLSFADNARTLWVALEEPLYEDGARADVEESTALVRFYRYDAATRKITGQFAYDLEPVAHAPILSTAFRVNGVTDILEAGTEQLLVVERSFSTGRLPCTVKLFLADFRKAQDVSNTASLNGTNTTPATKQLLLDMDSLAVHVDNVEGVTWGPLLRNGNRSLLLVTDNNFQEFQKTQIFLFEVVGK